MSKMKKAKSINLQEIRRQLKLFWLKAKNGNMLMIFVSLLTFGVFLIFSYISMTSTSEYDSHSSQIIDTNKCSGAAAGIGEALPNERVLLKREKISIVNIPAADKMYDKVQTTLRKVELSMTRGWNVSEPIIMPLGDADYVRRDLPVYKNGFEALYGFNVQKRFAGGVFNAKNLADQKLYNGILCLSFNTDHCFPPENYNLIGISRKVNRILGLRDIVWSKDKFCRTLNSATRGIMDETLLSFSFPCWVMPKDYKALLKYSREHNLEQWIAKPRSLGAGKGIYVVNDWDELSRERKTGNLIQSYLTNPHLIERTDANGDIQKYKWDMRTYVLCTSITPLRAYVYTRGLVRIATSPYTRDCKNKTSCLTNTSINKKVEGAQLKDITWSLAKLKKYLDSHEEDENFDDIFLRIQKAIGMALISSESSFKKLYLKQGVSCQNCYQLLGVDIIFDDDLEPKVVEINGEPSLKLTGNGRTHYDITKKNMGKDLVAIVYNRDSAVDKTAISRRLMDWAKCVSIAESEDNVQSGEENSKKRKKSKNTFIGKDHLEYLLTTYREHSKLGKFKPIYPNPKLAEHYGRFLKALKEKEPASTPEEKQYNAHGDGRRLRLHNLVTALLEKEALVIGKYGQMPNQPEPVKSKKKKLLKPQAQQSDNDDDDDDGY